MPVAVAASRRPALVASRAQGLGQLFLEHPLNGFEDPATHLRLDALAEAQQSASPVVAFDLAWPSDRPRGDLWRQLGRLRHLTISTGLGPLPLPPLKSSRWVSGLAPTPRLPHLLFLRWPG